MTENNIGEELRQAGDRDKISAFERLYLDLMRQYSTDGKDPRALKQGFAVELSSRLAVSIADALRPRFKGIRPLGYRNGGESRTATGRGDSRLDVNYSTQRKGLALGVSIKTLNFKDPQSGRYTKNVKRIDKELRTEAGEIHDRQRYAVLGAVVFMPEDACEDVGKRGKSSFAHAYSVLQARSGRVSYTDKDELFEKLFVGLYCAEKGERFGDVRYVEVLPLGTSENAPQRTVPFADIISSLVLLYEQRNPGG